MVECLAPFSKTSIVLVRWVHYRPSVIGSTHAGIVMMIKRTLLLFALPFVLSPPQSAQAQRTDQTGLYAAATKYREHVIYFEKLIQKVRGIQRMDEKLVNEFEQATRQLRLAARNPRHSSRLRKEWADIQALQFRVESVIFGKYTLNRDIVWAWNCVLYSQAIVYDEYVFLLDNPRHDARVTRRTRVSNPERFLPPPPTSSGQIIRPTIPIVVPQ